MSDPVPQLVRASDQWPTPVVRARYESLHALATPHWRSGDVSGRGGPCQLSSLEATLNFRFQILSSTRNPDWTTEDRIRAPSFALRGLWPCQSIHSKLSNCISLKKKWQRSPVNTKLCRFLNDQEKPRIALLLKWLDWSDPYPQGRKVFNLYPMIPIYHQIN